MNFQSSSAFTVTDLVDQAMQYDLNQLRPAAEFASWMAVVLVCFLGLLFLIAVGAAAWGFLRKRR